jgi:CheY-like chemotaxis protein
VYDVPDRLAVWRIGTSPPVPPCEAVFTPTDNGVTHAGQPLRILVVDDCADTRASLAMLLHIWGHEARTTADGPSALQECRAFRPQVVLLDIGLPGMNGWEVAHRLRGQDSRPALLVALTGFGRVVDRALSRDAGFDAHLTKPADPKDLRQLLATAGRTLWQLARRDG